MEQKDLREYEARCIQEEPPACRAGCPLGVDARGFVQAVAKDNLAAARAILEKSMPLAGIVARMCEAPCEQYCLRDGLGGSISIGLLEHFCIREAPAKGKFLKLPQRLKKVAVIGAGPSSLTVAFDLGKKGYPVSVFHTGEGPGGWLCDTSETVLGKEILQEELSRLETLRVSFHKVDLLDESIVTNAGFDAVYLGQDDVLAEDLEKKIGSVDDITFVTTQDDWFSGGFIAKEHQYRFILDVSQGREAAISIDRFLQGASLTAARLPLRYGKTDLYTSLKGRNSKERVVPQDGVGYTLEEAKQEAGRCFDCQCLECVKHCEYLRSFEAYPKIYARRVYNNSAIVKGTHQANRFINSCSLCGQCETICPNDFSMADLCLDARRTMVQENRMPPSAHWFALEEMRSARSEGSFVRHAPGKSSSTKIFYPGCQLAGIRPEQTFRLYEYLREVDPATGLWLDCCGAPGHWAGRKQEFADILSEIQKNWEGIGEPVVVTACSTCLKMFRDHLPHIPVESVWVLCADIPPSAARARAAMALSDPCTSRHDANTQTAVRNMLENIGQQLTPLAMSGELTECCGFGGLMENANSDVAKKVTAARVKQTDSEMLTYCAMCRDQLARTGKPVSHVLDLLFSDTAVRADEPSPTISARRINRRRLLYQVLELYPDEKPTSAEKWEELSLHISPELSALLEERRILEDDIRKVLYQEGQKGTTFVHGETGSRIRSARLGQVTFYIQYKKENETYIIESCWFHRMIIAGGVS